jgi:hypothetical protein
MLACWGPECFPSAPGEQVHFARALMESAAKEMAEAVGVPYPVEDEVPAVNPVAGVIDLLKQIENTLTTLNGVFAVDIEAQSTMHWQVDVAAEIEGIGALLRSMQEIPA